MTSKNSKKKTDLKNRGKAEHIVKRKQSLRTTEISMFFPFVLYLLFFSLLQTSTYAPQKARLVDLFVGLCVIVVDVKLAMELMVFLSFSLM